jgi:hypothetical protein
MGKSGGIMNSLYKKKQLFTEVWMYIVGAILLGILDASNSPIALPILLVVWTSSRFGPVLYHTYLIHKESKEE